MYIHLFCFIFGEQNYEREQAFLKDFNCELDIYTTLVVEVDHTLFYFIDSKNTFYKYLRSWNIWLKIILCGLREAVCLIYLRCYKNAVLKCLNLPNTDHSWMDWWLRDDACPVWGVSPASHWSASLMLASHWLSPPAHWVSSCSLSPLSSLRNVEYNARKLHRAFVTIVTTDTAHGT